MLLKPEISIGDILTIVSIAVSVIALLISWQKSQELKRKEFADKIRRGASTVVVKIQRWRELSLRFFEDIQPLITEADMELVKNQKVSDVRDVFWLKISDIRTTTSQRIIDEQVETAYIDLFGFDPRIQTLFTELIKRLKAIDNSIYTQARYSTQADILSFLNQSIPYTSTELGNKLRNTCYLLRNEYESLMDESIDPFIKEMVRLVEQSDRQIIKRQFKISSTADLYPLSLNQLQDSLDKQDIKKLLQTTALSIPHGQLNLGNLAASNRSPAGISIASVLPKSTLLVPLQTDQQTIGTNSVDYLHHEKVLEELGKESTILSDLAAMAAKAISQANKEGDEPRRKFIPSSTATAKNLHPKENRNFLGKQTGEPFRQKPMSTSKRRKKKRKS